MILNMTMGGFYLEDGERVQMNPIIHPTLTQLEKLLFSMQGKRGVLVIKNKVDEDEGPYQLTLYADNHYYHLMLNEIHDEDDQVRTLYDAKIEGEAISILGDYYSVNTVTNDFNKVFDIFKEFCFSGNVSTEYLV